MKVLGILVVVASVAVAATTAAADPVVDAFYNRCVSENAYQMAPNELESACACMAPVMVSFLTDDARRQVEAGDQEQRASQPRRQPVQGQSADLARSAIQQCPSVGKAMYAQKCAGGNEAAPQCQEMKGMIDQAQ